MRKVVDSAKLKLPVFGPLFQKIAIARFARNFSTMIKPGVPILQSLAVVGETSGNWVIEEAMHKVQESVRVGRSIAAPLMAEPVFPSMVSQMVAVGEDSGSMETMLAKIADFYDDEVQSTTEQSDVTHRAAAHRRARRGDRRHDRRPLPADVLDL